MSFEVMLFWLPILLIAGYAISSILIALQGQFLAQAMLFVLLVQPIFIMLLILAIRAALTVMGATKGADFMRTFAVVFNVLKYNVTFMWMIIFVAGASTTLLGINTFHPDFFTEIRSAKTIADISGGYSQLFRVLQSFPVFLFGGWLLGICAAIGAIGVTLGAAAAMAAVEPPNHSFIWGTGAQFVNLFTFSTIVIFAPFYWAISTYGGTEIQISDLFNLSANMLYLTATYILWVVCAIATAIALAYTITVKNDAGKAQLDIEELANVAKVQTTDLAALRKSRAKK